MSARQSASLAFIVFGLLSSPAPAQPAVSIPAAKVESRLPSRAQLQAADRLAEAFASTWNRRDGDGYGNAYWPDAELVDPSGQIWRGRRAIIETHRDLWAGPAKSTHMEAHVRRVQRLGPTLFVVDIDTSATGFSPPPPGADGGTVKTRLKHVVERRNGVWKILTSQNTFVS